MLRFKFFLNYKFGLVGVAIFLFVGLIVGRYWDGLSDGSESQHQLQQLRDKNNKLKLELSKTTITLDIERNTIIEMNSTLSRQQSELVEQQQALRFYQRVMASEATANGIQIEDVNVEAGVSENHYRFELLLAQLEKRRRYIKGEVVLTLIGSQQDQPKSVVLKQPMLLDKSLKFSFRYFQSVAGEFILPSDFTPEQLEVRLKMSKRSGQRSASVVAVYPWDDIITIPLKPLLEPIYP